MAKDFELSDSDKSILSLIINELIENEEDITFQNIQKHPLFEKLDTKDILRDQKNVCLLGCGVKQTEPGQLSIEFSGTGINLQNPLHRKHVDECLIEVGRNLLKFSKFIKEVGLENFHLSAESSNKSSLYSSLQKIWKKN